MRRPAKYLNLKRARVRQSWNKHNLYNMVMMTGGVDTNSRRTFFQQKWSAKSMTRGYHGEHIPEKKWKRMFSRRLSSAVDMPPEYLAKHDGSEQGAGRGSGLMTNSINASNYSQAFDDSPQRLNMAHPRMNFAGHTVQTKLLTEGMKDKITPVMNMVYAPLERRLDTAIFRSLFATSIRQARQFVVHGAVKVNGKKMAYPAYQLNPGDMFQVDAVKVLTATAAQKKGEPNTKVKKMMENNISKYENFEARYDALIERMIKRGGADKYEEPMPVELGEAAAGEAAEEAAAEESSTTAEPTGDDATSETTVAEKTTAAKATKAPPKKLTGEEKEMEMKRVKLETALIDAKFIVRHSKLSDVEKQFRIASFKDRANHFLGKWSSTLPPTKLIGELVKDMRKLDMLRGETEGTDVNTVAKALEIDGLSWKANRRFLQAVSPRDLALEEMQAMGAAMTKDSENTVSGKLPYATPWQPRAWMKPWVFIPRYLEVNHKICASVYLRHPVARKGQAEVPTPFHYFSNQLAHAWYVTKGVSKYKHKPN